MIRGISESESARESTPPLLPGSEGMLTGGVSMAVNLQQVIGKAFRFFRH